jgi:hypothetical protein
MMFIYNDDDILIAMNATIIHIVVMFVKEKILLYIDTREEGDLFRLSMQRLRRISFTPTVRFSKSQNILTFIQFRVI